MTAPRLIALILAVLTPAVAYRVGGTNLWLVNALGYAIAAAGALYILWQDGLLEDVMKPKGLDLSAGVVAAALMYMAFFVVWRRFVAPSDEAGGLLGRCTLTGPLLPRTDAHGITAVWEYVRTQTCRGYATSLGVTGPARGLGVVAISALEEIAWRGGVQQTLAEKYGTTRGWILCTLLYAIANAASGNLLLGLLGLIGGLVWGGLFRYRQRVIPAVFSHMAFSYFLFHKFPLVSF